MMIEKPGRYRTKSGHDAEVTEIRNDLAIGWVKSPERSVPSCWKVDGGAIWAGTYGDEIVSMVNDQTEPPESFRITTPGHYRTRNGRRVEVVAVRSKARGTVYAVGYDDTCALTWISNGEHWNWATGTQGSNRALDIVAPWHDPVTATVQFALVERQGVHEVVWARNIGLSRVLATRTITITEGEGMPCDQSNA